MSKATASGHAAWALGLVVFIGTCVRDAGHHGVVEVRSALTSVNFTLPLLMGEDPTDVALAAGSTLSVNDRAGVVEASGGSYALVSQQ